MVSGILTDQVSVSKVKSCFILPNITIIFAGSYLSVTIELEL